MNTWISTGLAALTFASAVAVADQVAPAEVMEAKVGYKAPNFTLHNQAGEPVSLSDFEGKVVVLEWVNPDCPFVKPHYAEGNMTMKDLATDYAESDVVWLSINTTHYFDQKANSEWQASNELPYPVLSDVTGTVGHMYGAKTTPHMYIVNAEGMLAYNGAIDDNPRGKKAESTNYVKIALDEIIAGKSVSMAQTKPYGCSVKYAKKAS